MILAAVAATVVSAHCSNTERSAKDPVTAYRTFYSAASSGDWKVAMELLDARTRSALEAAERQLASRQGNNGVQEDVVSLTALARGRVHGPLHSVSVVRTEGDRAALRVEAGRCEDDKSCEKFEVDMVREDGGWRVKPVLPEELVRYLPRGGAK
ncbi:MAG: hypothetical protein D6806_11950 [Deltaproteobacteria bacterium]|nr:MAG: hypothetical protein D6806_11950 [Deltaproteobacteria bacterium]